MRCALPISTSAPTPSAWDEVDYAAAARWALREEGGDASDDAADRLADAVASVAADVPYGDDATAAEALAELGPKGREAAKRWRVGTTRRAEKGRDPADRWRPGPDGEPPAVLTVIAVAVWCDRVAPALDRERRRPPAVSVGVALPLGQLHRPGNVLRTAGDDRDVATAEGHHVAPIELPLAFSADRGTSLATTPSGVVAAILDRLPTGAGRLGTLLGHRLLRWELFAAHAGALADPPTQTCRVAGGWSGLAAEVLGTDCPRPADVRDLRAILSAQRTAALRWPDGGVGPMAHSFRFHRT